MAKDPVTRDLSDRHEADIARLFGGTVQRGSGNQPNRQLDVRMDPHNRHTPIAFGFDGKATQRGSHTVTLDAWHKLCEQAHELRPAMPLRFYAPTNTLPVRRDLVVVELHDFAEVLELANIYREMRDR